jgi:membrane protein
LRRGRLHLHELLRGKLARVVGSSNELGRGGRERRALVVFGERRGNDGAVSAREDSDLDLRRDLGQVGERLRGVHGGQTYQSDPDLLGGLAKHPLSRGTFRQPSYTGGAVHPVIHKLGRDRATHLAAMIAYFALLSFVPLLFLALSLTALAGQQSESSYLIEELRRTFPATSVDRLLDVVDGIQEEATGLRIVGGIGLLWAALGFFSVLESAFNIVYGLPNRPFVRQKLFVLLLVAASLVVLFVALVIGSVGVELVRRAGVAGDVLSYVYALLVSTALLFGFLWSLYKLLTNTDLTWEETLPGAIVSAALLQASFQVLPIFLRATNELIYLQAFGGFFLLLIWLYVMANVLVLGATINWWVSRGRVRAKEETPAGLA